MKTKTSLSTRLAFFVFPPVALLAAGGTLGACAAELQSGCPDGTVQTAGGGDVSEACTPAGELGGSGGAPGGGPGAGAAGTGPGGVPSMGSGGRGGIGGGGTIPPDGVCVPETTKCGAEGQQTCDGTGQWGAAAACEIACNGEGEGKACVVPVQLAAGSRHVCALLSDATVRCWGAGTSGELGNGSSDANSAIPVPVRGLNNATAVTSGSSTNCAVRSDKTVACWGNNRDSVINQSSELALSEPVTLDGAAGVAQAAVGDNHLCVLTEAAVVQCKGRNSSGQLGNNSTALSPTFVNASPFTPPPQQISSAGESVNCSVLGGGSVACWGSGFTKANGSPTRTNLLVPTLVDGVASVRKVVASDFSCGLREDKNLICWGDNSKGQLGRGVVASGGTQPGFGPALVTNLGNVVDVAVSKDHACAIKADKSLWCWGDASSGQLGIECGGSGDSGACESIPSTDGFASPSPVRVALDNVAEVVAGSGFTCARTNDSKLYCWGQNGVGQLGIAEIGSLRFAPTAVVWQLWTLPNRVHTHLGHLVKPPRRAPDRSARGGGIAA